MGQLTTVGKKFILYPNVMYFNLPTKVLLIKTEGGCFSKFPTHKKMGGVRWAGNLIKKQTNKKLTCTNCGRRSVSSSSLMASIQVTATDLTS